MSNVTALRTPAGPVKAAPGAEVIADPFLSPEQLCELVPGMTTANLKDLRASGRGPVFFKPTGKYGHVTLYRRSDVIAWVERARNDTREQS